MTPESLQVEVGVVRAFEAVFCVPQGSPDLGASWEQLQRVELAVDPDQTLRNVLGRACDAAGITLTEEARHADEVERREHGRAPATLHVRDLLVYTGFRRPDDDQPVARSDGSPMVRRETRRWPTVLIVRDREGRAVWKRPGLEATMAELLDAADIELIDGNPLQPYLIPSMPQGDIGAFGEWVEFSQALRALWDVVEVAATAGGAVAFVELLSRLSQRRSEVPSIVDRNASGWAERGAAPADLVRFLASADRTSGEIAALLGCSNAEAEALLWGMGFAFDPASRYWRYKGDSLACMVADDVDLSFADVFKGPGGQDRYRDFATRRVEKLLSTGKPPTTGEAKRDVAERTSRDLAHMAEAASLRQRLRRRFRWRQR